MKPGYQPGLDGLRAVAVIVVLVFHSDLGWMPGGFLGVSVFFTLSGFLITSLLLAEIGRVGRVDLPAFWERRVRRLLPASLLTIIGVSFAAVWLSTPVEQSRLRGDALAAVFYAGNWRSILADLSYDEIFSTRSPLIHLWSLGIEEQMYLIVPLVVVAVMVRTRSSRQLGVVAVALAGASTFVSVFLVSGDRLYYGTDARAAELLIGMAAAALFGQTLMEQDRRLPKLWNWIPIAALGAIVWLVRTSSTDSAWVYAGLLPAFTILSLICVIGAIVPGPLQTMLSVPPLASIGRFSYGLYLFHWPIFVWLDGDRVGLSGVALFAAQVAVTSCLAIASYNFFEKPIRQKRVLATRRSLVVGLGAMTAVAVLVPVTLLEAVSGEPSTEVRVLSTVPSTVPAAIEGVPEGPLRILVIGDSTAENVARAIADTGAMGVVSAGVLGCPLVRTSEVFDRPRASQETSYCPDNVEVVRSHAGSVDLVLVVGGVSNQWSYTTKAGVRVDPGSAQYQQDFDDLMGEIFEILAPWGVPVVVLDNPVTRSEEAVLGDEPVAHAAWRAQIERWDEMWGPIARISIDDVLALPDSQAGRIQRPDGVHLEEVFAAQIARDRLVPQLISIHAELLGILDESGCRVSSGERKVFDLQLCQTNEQG